MSGQAGVDDSGIECDDAPYDGPPLDESTLHGAQSVIRNHLDLNHEQYGCCPSREPVEIQMLRALLTGANAILLHLERASGQLPASRDGA